MNAEWALTIQMNLDIYMEFLLMITLEYYQKIVLLYPSPIFFLHKINKTFCIKYGKPLWFHSATLSHSLLLTTLLSCGLFIFFSGQTCEVDIKECVKNPCRNGATCQNTLGSYRCGCKPGFTGRNCETNIDDCKPSKTFNLSSFWRGLGTLTP